MIEKVCFPPLFSSSSLVSTRSVSTTSLFIFKRKTRFSFSRDFLFVDVQSLFLTKCYDVINNKCQHFFLYKLVLFWHFRNLSLRLSSICRPDFQMSSFLLIERRWLALNFYSKTLKQNEGAKIINMKQHLVLNFLFLGFCWRLFSFPFRLIYYRHHDDLFQRRVIYFLQFLWALHKRWWQQQNVKLCC